jgi:3-hydroxypropanoate dehydrogenase
MSFNALNDAALNQLFREARTVHAFKDTPVSDAVIHQLYDLLKIVAQDTQFHEHLPTQFPGYDAKPLFDANPAMTEATAARNSSMQGAYLILAARALGLDSGAMSGFNPQVVNEAFFADGRFKTNFLINLGVADPAGVHPRGPRLAFDEAAQIL